jgi:exodeoxyribonuclease X
MYPGGLDDDDDNRDGGAGLTANPTFDTYHLRRVDTDTNGVHRERDISFARPIDWYRGEGFAPLRWNQPLGPTVSGRSRSISGAGLYVGGSDDRLASSRRGSSFCNETCYRFSWIGAISWLLMEKRVRIIDTETTGVEPTDQLVEIASVDWTEDGLGNSLQTMVRPTIEIPATASAIHHIRNRDVADAPLAKDAIARFADAPIFAAHNARFDRMFLPFEGPWVCTYKVALSLFPDAPAHSNQVLRYWLDLADPPAEAGQLAHRALYDAWTTAFLFERFLEDLTVAQMVTISASPALLPRFSFGKHARIPLSDVPKDYLAWVVGQEFDEDVRFTAQHYLDLG